MRPPPKIAPTMVAMSAMPLFTLPTSASENSMPRSRNGVLNDSAKASESL